VASDSPGPDDSLHAEQRAARVASALATLPNEQREIIELAYMQDLPQRSIAKKLSLPLGTVKSRMRLAYNKLKDRLEDYK
jgi:RNA polymerase sigma-70 factor, ECF subfamily